MVPRYLEQYVGGVVKQHDQRADANVVGAVGEAQQGDGGQVVDHLLSKVLWKQHNTLSISVCGKNTLVECGVLTTVPF